MTQELEKELVEFYLVPNSAREIERKYGVNWYQLKKILAKYNIPQHSKSDAYKLRDERTKEVCLERYGVENPFAAEEVKEKIKQSMLERHGVEYVGQAEISKQKSTCEEMQMVLPCSYFITTLSTQLPSERPNKNLTVPSMADTNLSSTSGR